MFDSSSNGWFVGVWWSWSAAAWCVSIGDVSFMFPLNDFIYVYIFTKTYSNYIYIYQSMYPQTTKNMHHWIVSINSTKKKRWVATLFVDCQPHPCWLWQNIPKKGWVFNHHSCGSVTPSFCGSSIYYRSSTWVTMSTSTTTSPTSASTTELGTCWPNEATLSDFRWVVPCVLKEGWLLVVGEFKS